MPECAYCFKAYEKHIHLTRHERICGLVHHKRVTRDDDDEPLPSMRQLYEVLLHLVDENKRLKEKVGRLTVKQQREWSLEEAIGSAVPCQSFREWSKSLAATPEHLEYVFEHGRADGLAKLVGELFGGGVTTKPFRAFRQRKDTVYAFKEDGKWSKLENSEWELFINTLDKMLYVQFEEWQKAHATQLSEPKFQEIYLLNMSKLRSGRGEVTKVKRTVYATITESVS